MLMIGTPQRWITWEEAEIELLLSPLPLDLNADFVRACMQLEDGPDGKPQLTRDAVRYAELVGSTCIHDWKGVTDANGTPATCNDANKAQFMQIGPAQAFVFGKVRGLSIYVGKETAAAKKD